LDVLAPWAAPLRDDPDHVASSSMLLAILKADGRLRGFSPPIV
jgi:hypothetical protein